MARNPSPHIQLERIKFIVQFLNKGGGSYLELEDFLNTKLREVGYPEVGKRAIQYDLNKLVSGDFAHSQSNLTQTELSSLFRYEYMNKKYQWHKDSKIPKFDDLEDEERQTLPFLFGVLKRYQSIPAMQKIMDMLEEKYQIAPDERNKDEIFFVQHIAMNDAQFEKKLVTLALQLIGHIQRSEVIEFLYTWVGELGDNKDSYSYFKVAPLQVKLYENYYYISGIDIIKNKIVNFRLDQIKKLNVDVALDEREEEIIYFDKAALHKKYALKTHFKHVLGVWTHKESDELHRITIEFKEWAASYVRHLKFHPSQRFVSMDPISKTYTLSFDLLLWPESINGKKVKERSPELYFLLGRFRECARIVQIEQIGI